MRKYLITGGAGFIGSYIAEALASSASRPEVVVVDDMSGADYKTIDDICNTVSLAHANRSNISLLQEDCGSAQAMDYVLSAYSGVDTLIHCAANAREGASQFQPTSVTYRNYMAYVNTLTQAIKYGVRNVVLFSSMAVYGNGIPPFSEEDPLSPVDVYAVNKSAMEQTTHILAKVYGFAYCIVRPHNVFGPRQVLWDRFRNVCAIFMNQIMREEPISIYGDGKQRRAFSYIKDSLPCFVAMAERTQDFNAHVINVGGMEDITVLDLAHAIIEEMTGKSTYPIIHLPDRPCEVKHAFSTYEKSMRLLNYQEITGWRRGIRDMAMWAKAKGQKEWTTTDKVEIQNDLLPKPWEQFT